jgi:UDP-2-acetamido-3-amino-2,3-dideoxy-glucuronate N-acetyltransferase
MKIEKPGIAVIGSGYWGKNLVRNFAQLGSLKAICDTNETTLIQFKEQYPEVETCLAYSDVLANQEIHGIVIAAPAELHYSMAREAILAGKHIYIEKPLVLVESEGEALIKLAKEKDRVLMVGHLLHYHPVFIRLKKLAKSGELGRINYIYSNRLNLGKIRREENILWSFAPHDISMILSLAGEQPKSVMATGGYYLHQKIADVTTTHMAFSSGLQAHIFVSWLHPFKEQKLVVVGDKKMAVFDDTQPWGDKLQLYPHEIHWENNIPVPLKAEAEKLEIPQSEPLKEECQHFLDCITSNKQPITDGREGLSVLSVLIASQKSLDNKGALVEIESDEVVDTSSSEYFSHSSAEIDSGCEIGKDSKIWHFSHIMSGSQIGEQCNIGQNVVIGPDASIGKGCKIQNNVSVYKGVTLEDYVFCGPSMVFTNIYNPRAEIRKMDQVRKTLVKKGSTLGANCTIVCGTTIGKYAFIGAGAVVNKDVPDYALMVGNPARRIGWVCECGVKLMDDCKCPECNKRYEDKGGEMEIISAD